MIRYRLLAFEFFQLSRRNLQQLLEFLKFGPLKTAALSVSRDRLTVAFALNGVRKLIGVLHTRLNPKKNSHIKVY